MTKISDEIRREFMAVIEKGYCTCGGAEKIDHELVGAAIRTGMDFKETQCRYCIAVTGIGALNRLDELQKKRKSNDAGD